MSTSVIHFVGGDTLEVDGDPASVVSALHVGWGRLKRPEEVDPSTVEVNGQNVLYVELAEPFDANSVHVIGIDD